MSEKVRHPFRDWSAAAPFAVVILVYLVTWWVLPQDGFWINDNGAKLIQARGIALQGGRDVSIPWPGQTWDPLIQHSPIPAPIGQVSDAKLYVTYSLPFALVSALLWRLFGLWGMYLIPLLGAIITIWATSQLVGALGGGRKDKNLAVILVGLGTPLWFYSQTIWEHSIAAGLAVLAVVQAIKFIVQGDARRMLLAGACCAAGAYFRIDQALLALAILIVVSCIARQRARGVTCFLAAFLVAIVPLFLLHWLMLGHPAGFHLGAHSPLRQGLDAFLSQRIDMFRRLVLNCHSGMLWTLLGAGPFLVLMLVRPRLPAHRHATWSAALLVLGAVNMAVVLGGLISAQSPMWWLIDANGLFAAAPFAGFAFLRHARSEAAEEPCAPGIDAPAQSALLQILVLYVVGYAAVSPSTSVGIHWGGRFLLPVYAIMAALAATNLIGLGHRSRRRAWLAPATVATIVALSLGLQIYSIGLLHQRKSFNALLNRAVAERPEKVVICQGWFLPQELAGNFYDKTVFLPPSPLDRATVMNIVTRTGNRNALIVSMTRGDVRSSAADTNRFIVLRDTLNFLTIVIQAIEIPRY